MASEIRVLEDQLYDADYQNRVLRDKLEQERAIRSRSTPERMNDRVHQSYGPPVDPAPISDPAYGGPDYGDSDYGDPDYGDPVDSDPAGSDPIESYIDEGQRVDPGELESGTTFPEFGDESSASSDPPTPRDPSDRSPLRDPAGPIAIPTPDPDTDAADTGAGTDQTKQSDRDSVPKFELPPAPGLPEPPGPDDLLLPPIVPGEILPPPQQGDEPEKPPGQVELPESLQAKKKQLAPATEPPQELKIHPGISGGHQFDQDDEVDGLFVVVNALDRNGRMVDLSSFDVDADLSLVVLDPALPPSEAKIGRWDFTSEQVAKLVRSHPVSGLHIALQWQDTQPLGDEVIVHVRLVAGEEEMRCEGRLRVDQSVATAKWTPRGEPMQR